MAVGCVRQIDKVTAHTYIKWNKGHNEAAICTDCNNTSTQTHSSSSAPSHISHFGYCWHTSLSLPIHVSLSLCLRHLRINKIRNTIKENNVPAIAIGFAFISADTINIYVHIYDINLYVSVSDICILCDRRIRCYNLLADVSDFTFHSPSIRHNHYALIPPPST